MILTDKCPKCVRGILCLKENRSTRNVFWGCGSYPECRFTKPYFAEETRSFRNTNVSSSAKKGIKSLIFKWHPDRYKNKIEPGDVVRELIELMETM